MNEKFKVAADVEELVSQLEDTVKALDFWAMHFVSGMNDMLVEDDARVIAWACKEHGPGCLSAFNLIHSKLAEDLTELDKLTNQLYAESREKPTTGAEDPQG